MSDDCRAQKPLEILNYLSVLDPSEQRVACPVHAAASQTHTVIAQFSHRPLLTSCMYLAVVGWWAYLRKDALPRASKQAHARRRHSTAASPRDAPRRRTNIPLGLLAPLHAGERDKKG